jgi:hypothetical protein
MCGDVDKLVETRELRPECGEAEEGLSCKLCSQFGNLQKPVLKNHRYSKNIATLVTAV